MGAHKKQRIFNILTILALAVILTCIFAACDKTDAQENNYKVTIHPNNGQADIVWDAKSDIPDITYYGYHIVGYYLDEDFTTSTTLESLKSTELTKNIDVYVKWEKDSVPPKTRITTNNLNCDIDNRSISGKVSNGTTTFSFIDEISVEKGTTYTISTDINGINTIPSKTVNLEIGDNVFYILVQNGEELTLYTATVRRKPMYTVAFDTKGGTEVKSQQVEEDSFATEPTTERSGYTFDQWDWNFTNAITEDKTITASWDIITYKITYDLNGGENPSTNPSTYTVEDEIVLAAPTKTGYTGTWSDGGQIAKGSTGDKHFVASYTINQYNLTTSSSINNSCEYTTGGVYDYASSITLSATPYLGYDFVGWYDGDTLLSKENTYVFTMPASNLTITAKTTVRADMQKFAFSSAIDSCTITGAKDKSITELTVPDCVTNIEEGAFNGCSSLTSITIPFVGAKAGLTSSSTYQYPFGYIFGTSSYTGGVATKQSYYGSSTSSTTSTTYYIPSSLKSVTVTGGNMLYGAFYNCTSLTSVTIPDSVTSIGGSAFNGCSSLESVTIPDGVTSIGSSAFRGCTGLTSITIPDSVTSIGHYAFDGCSGLKNVYITDIAKWCSISFRYNLANPLYYAKDLYINGEKPRGNFEIPVGTKTIPYGTFRNCTGLTSITIPDSVTSIGSYAFEDCTGLTSVTIGSGVTSIGDGAFNYCYKLVEVCNKSTLAITVGSSGNGSVACYAKNVYTTEGGSKLSTDDNGYVIYTDDAEKILVAYIGSETELALPSDMTQINHGAFYDSTSLTRIVIPNSVKGIGQYAFDGCSGLTSIVIPDSVTDIGMSAFSGCSGLTSVTIPNSVTSIGSSAFIKCSGLTSIDISDSVISIDNYVFSDCTGLTSITIPDSVTSIGSFAFSGCTSLTSIAIPNSVTSIGDDAFHNTAWYSNQPDGLVYAGKVAYNYKGIMPNNSSITLEDGTLGIADCAFKGCSGLTSIVIPDSVTSIGWGAFNGCTGLTSIIIPNSVTSIGSSAFFKCSGLTSIVISDSVTSIGSYAFRGCTGLTNIVISDSVTSIEKCAFDGCTGLTNITFTGTKAQWNAISKGSNWNYNVPSTCEIICTDGTI